LGVDMDAEQLDDILSDDDNLGAGVVDCWDIDAAAN